MTSSRKMAISPLADERSCNETANLIRRIANGDEAAFRLFYDGTNGLLFGLLLRILGHTQTAECVLSELYEEVRRKAARFGKKNEGTLTWLIFIAHRRAIECLCRKLTTQAEIYGETAGTDSTSRLYPSINITGQRRLIRAVIDSIPHSQRRMIELAFFSGMSNLGSRNRNWRIARSS